MHCSRRRWSPPGSAASRADPRRDLRCRGLLPSHQHGIRSVAHGPIAPGPPDQGPSGHDRERGQVRLGSDRQRRPVVILIMKTAASVPMMYSSAPSASHALRPVPERGLQRGASRIRGPPLARRSDRCARQEVVARCIRRWSPSSANLSRRVLEARSGDRAKEIWWAELSRRCGLRPRAPAPSHCRPG